MKKGCKSGDIISMDQNILIAEQDPLALTRIAAAALEAAGFSGLEQLASNIAAATSLGDAKVEAFTQSMRLLQQSPTFELTMQAHEQRLSGLYNLDEVFALLAEPPEQQNYHYVLKTQQHSLLLSRIFDADGADYYVFVDAKFGAAVFGELAQWQQAVKAFLVDQEYAIHAYDAQRSISGVVVEPVFGLRKIDAKGLARVSLSSEQSLNLSSLYQSDIRHAGGLLASDRNHTLVTKLSPKALGELAIDMTPEQRAHFLNDLFLKKEINIVKLDNPLVTDDVKLDAVLYVLS